MLVIIIALAAGVTGGQLAGGLIGWLSRRRAARADAQPLYTLDPDLDRRIADAASRWASARGRPDAARLVADKLRLLHRINSRRVRVGARRRWWR